MSVCLHILFKVQQDRATAMKHSWKYGNYSLSAHERPSGRAQAMEARNLCPNWGVGP